MFILTGTFFYVFLFTSVYIWLLLKCHLRFCISFYLNTFFKINLQLIILQNVSILQILNMYRLKHKIEFITIKKLHSTLHHLMKVPHFHSFVHSLLSLIHCFHSFIFSFIAFNSFIHSFIAFNSFIHLFIYSLLFIPPVLFIYSSFYF